jgi:outer membrane lipoprotein SlyB
MTFAHRLRSAVCVGLVASLCWGCSTGLETRYGDATDVCRPARQPLIDTQKNFNLTIAQGAGIGTLAGAAIGGLATGSWKGAAIGAGAGLLAGGLAGYYKAKVAQAHTQQALLASIDQDAGRDVTQMQTSISAIDQLVSCRDAEISNVESQYSSHAISRDQAIAEMTQIRAQLNGDDQLIAEVLNKSTEHANTYISARARAPELPPEPSQAVVSTDSVDLLVMTNQQATAAKAKLQQPVNRVADFLTARNELL